MMTKKLGWWRWSAALCAATSVVIAVGILFDSEDTGQSIGRYLYLGAAIVGAALVTIGLTRRTTSRSSNLLVATGMLPAFPFVLAFWFPPIAAVGILAVVVSVVAVLSRFRDEGVAIPETTG